MAAALAMCIAVIAIGGEARGQDTPVNFKIAFIGDQYLGANSVAVLQLIDNEGSDVVVHSGDFDYANNPLAWDNQITSVLGPCFPYFASVGNHDVIVYYGASGYQSKLIARMNCLTLGWEGDLGVQSPFTYQGIFFVMTAPGVIASGNVVYAPYIHDELAANNSIWRISSWHKNMNAMQVGSKPNETGWGVYEEAREGGAIIATGHEHSYERTHPLSDCSTQTIADTSNMFTIEPGVTFVFVSGLGGQSIRDQDRCLPTSPPYGCNGEWASIYTLNQGANFGALFGEFNYNGDPCMAHFYFKDIDGYVADEFFVRSALGSCGCPSDCTPTGDGFVGISDFLLLLTQWGGPGTCDIDGGGVGITDFLAMLANWGPCP